VSDKRNDVAVDLVGGKLCLDFANTFEPPLGSQSDYLASYAHLARWASHAGSLSEEETQRLMLAAEDKPSEAIAAFERAEALRETVYRIFSAVARGEDPQTSDLDALSAAHLGALAHCHIIRTPDGYDWARATSEDKLESPLWPVVFSATGLLTSGDLERAKECPPDEGGCGWLFYDMSKNRSRRWCDMAGCGSRVKMRRYYYTHKRSGGPRGGREDRS
jgi:predicted RNA-binding Zn ribbon-like protein